jgi:hypothetical protein
VGALEGVEAIVLNIVPGTDGKQERFSGFLIILLKTKDVRSCISTGIGLKETWYCPLFIGMAFASIVIE